MGINGCTLSNLEISWREQLLKIQVHTEFVWREPLIMVAEDLKQNHQDNDGSRDSAAISWTVVVNGALLGPFVLSNFSLEVAIPADTLALGVAT